MLEPTSAAAVIVAAVSTCGVLLVFRFALVPTLCDAFRQRIFGIRRRLFLMRLDDIIDPHEAAYVQLMRRCNDLIRFAESITFGRLMMVSIAPPPKNIYVDRLDLAIEAAPTAVRADLLRLRLDIGVELVRHVVSTSALAWLTGIVLLPFITVALMVGRARHYLAVTFRGLASRPSIRQLEDVTADMSETAPAV